MNDQLFLNPPNEYGEVSFFWWQGDDITKEKLLWILDQLKNKQICGLQINYCHSDCGGFQYGLTMECNPKPLSEEWWELVTWFEKECQKYQIAVSLSDYTLGAPGQESYMDEVLRKNAKFAGKILKYQDNVISVEEVPYSANPMAKGIGQAVADEFYGAFERHMPGECGKGVNYFFSDELNFNIEGKLWSDDFAEEFFSRKHYDIVPKLKALFEDVGDETPKIRLDYVDVVVQLSEESFFRPIYEWHQKRGMTFGCDHGGRGYDVTEFGDYFRAMRWFQGPGNDQPHLESCIIKSKVSSSVAHLYKRPRVWLEGFYSSGWHVTAADVADATFRNFGLGHNLLSLHGLYYSTHGSMWEWAPPCNHYHMPYWKVMGEFLKCTKRLSYLLSQGVHRCDIAIIYPVAAMEADPAIGKKSVDTAFDTAEFLYQSGIDFDFIDFESIERAHINGKKLLVSGEEYQMVIVPDMQAVRFKMIEKLLDYAKRGGLVVFIGKHPSESDRAGRNDFRLDQIIREMKSLTFQVWDKSAILEIIDHYFCRDFQTDAENPYFIHRVIDEKDYYYVYGVPKRTSCYFRTKGKPVILDPWTGKKVRYTKFEVLGDRIHLCQPLNEKSVLLLEFETDDEKWNELPVYSDNYDYIIKLKGKWEMEIIPTMDNSYGDYRLPAFQGFIGAEGRELQYRISKTLEDDTQEWENSYYSYGTYFWIAEGTLDEGQAIKMKAPSEGFMPYRFSMKTGIQGDAGHQGSYHGLKGKISDEFLALGTKKITYCGSSSEYYGEGPYYVFTNIYADATVKVKLMHGTLKPEKIWIDHKEITEDFLDLTAGLHSVLLKYPKAGRTYFIVSKKAQEGFVQKVPLAMTWYQNPDILLFDAYPEHNEKICWYKLTAPGGTKSVQLSVNGEIQGVWLNGISMKKEKDRYTLDMPIREAGELTVSLKQARGCYDTAAFLEPVKFFCEAGVADLDRPIEEQGLKFYSGGIRFRKEIAKEKFRGRTALKLDNPEYAYEIYVNGKAAGIKISEPYLLDLTEYLTEEKNQLEVYAYNTLYNHMLTIPTNFNWWSIKEKNWDN